MIPAHLITSKHFVGTENFKILSGKILFLAALQLVHCLPVLAQKPSVAIKIGGSAEDNAYRSTTDNNGDIVIVGRFFGTTDFDPGPAVFNLTSNGSNDMFVAKYSFDGTLLWAFHVGGSDRDAAYSVVTDDQRNIYISGYFRGTVDFDPGLNTRNIISKGESGSDPGWSGEIFLAKYNGNGQYQWAFGIGGTTNADDGQDLILDHNKNLILGGYFYGTNVDFDPGASTYLLSSSSLAEDMFLAKYTTGGTFVWAQKMGGDIQRNEAIRKIAVDNANNIFITGFFGGTAQFGTGTGAVVLNASSMFEGFIAKYSSTGTFVWANQFGGSGFNQGWGIDVDTLNRYVYITGAVQGNSIRFTSPSSVANLSGNAGNDVFLARYDLNGNLSYAKVMAGPGNENGYSLAVNPTLNSLFITGYFEQTCDFDPSSSTSLLSSRGGLDIFVSRYQLDGTFTCAFNIGSIANDYAFDVRTNDSAIFVTGSFSGNQTDFDPSLANSYLSSSGDYDGFCVKYDWRGISASGILSGSTVCRGEVGKLTFSALSGTPPFTLTISDGVSNFVQKNVLDNVAFNVPLNPNTSTVYRIIAISDETSCATANLSSNDTALIIVNQPPSIGAIKDTSICIGDSIRLKASGGTAYQWTPSTGLDATNIAAPISKSLVSTTYQVVVTTDAGCRDSALTRINVKPRPIAAVSSATTICSGDSVRLSASGGTSYQWLPATDLSAVNIADPWAYPKVNTSYTVIVSNGASCADTAKTNVVVKLLPVIQLQDQSVCQGASATFDATQSSAISYLWSTGSEAPAITTFTEGTYSVAVRFAGCQNTVRDTVSLAVLPKPSVALGKDTILCMSQSFLLVPEGKNIDRYLWSTGSTAPILNIKTEGSYSLVVENSCGEASDTINVKMEICSDDIFFPNAFTPNRDGVNDIFKAAFLGGVFVTNYQLFVYNRWGQVVFKTNDPAKGWNGMFQGRLQQADVFVWQAIYDLSGVKGVKRKKGTVVLIR